jgi:glycosyltransferase involved in cell wall biosynthesis
MTANLSVAIDARLVPGFAGGVESVIQGLAGGLSQLETGSDERFTFLAFEGESEWLRPQVFGPSELVLVPRQTRQGLQGVGRRLVKAAFPRAGEAWANRPVAGLPGFRLRLPPSSDGRLEATGAGQVHFLRQSAVLTRLPSIYHPHDLQHLALPHFFSRRQRLQRDLWYRTFCEAASIVAVASAYTRRDVIDSYGLAPEKVVVVPLAPPTERFALPGPTEAAGILRRLGVADAPFIFYPAQTWPHKNHAELLKAIRLLADRGHRVRAVFSGHRNAHHRTLLRQARALSVEDQVDWLGHVSNAELMALYAAARAVVVPTLFEAASAPIWEAFLSGVPVACSNVTSLPEQVGDAAVVFDPHDTAAIADAIERVWSVEELRSELIRRGRETVGRLSWTRTARHFLALYRRIAGAELSEEDRLLLTEAPAF